MLPLKERASDLERLNQLVEAGKITPIIDQATRLTRCRMPCAISKTGRSAVRSPSPSDQIKSSHWTTVRHGTESHFRRTFHNRRILFARNAANAVTVIQKLGGG